MADAILPTHRRVLAIALPIVVSNATVPILGAVDTGVVGQLGEAAPIGAVGIGAIILTAFYWIFGFLRSVEVLLYFRFRESDHIINFFLLYTIAQ